MQIKLAVVVFVVVVDKERLYERAKHILQTNYDKMSQIINAYVKTI